MRGFEKALELGSAADAGKAVEETLQSSQLRGHVS